MSRVRLLQRVYCCFACISIVLILSPFCRLRAADTVLLTSGGNSVSFEVTVPVPGLVRAERGGTSVLIPGYGSFSPPGAFEYPGRTFRVAIPESGEFHVAYTVLETELIGPIELARVPGERIIDRGDGEVSYETYFPQDPWADAGIPPVVSAGRPCYMGRQRVLPVRLCPLMRGDGGYALARKLVIEVVMERVSRPGSDGAVIDEQAPTGLWERLYGSLLVNPGDVSRFQKRTKRARRDRSPVNGISMKIRVPETGIYAIRADSLIARGLPALSPDLLRLKKIYYDEAIPGLVREVNVPIRIVKGRNSGSLFEEDDVLVFYTMGIKDDTEAGDMIAKYSDETVLWLEEGAGAEMVEGAPLPSPASDPYTSFRAISRSRKDTFYHKWPRAWSEDYYFISGPVETQADLPFTVQGPSTAGSFSVTVELQGNDEVNMLNFDVNDSPMPLGLLILDSKDDVTYTFSGPSDLLVEGENMLYISKGERFGYLVNEFEVEYGALFVAHDDMLEFSVGSGTDSSVAITGFTVDRGLLVEITDPLNPTVYELSSGYFSLQTDDTYTLSFGLDGSAEPQRRFIALGEGAGGHIFNNSIEADTPSDLKGSTGPYNTLIISHESYLPPSSLELTDYADSLRGKQGYRILMADVQEVFDEFNGGIKSVEAIKRFIDYGVGHWGVEFVILVGDGSEDHKRVFSNSGIDFIPTYTYCMAALAAGYRDEVVSTDKYYAFLDESSYLNSGRGGVEGGPDEAGGSASAHPVEMQVNGYPDVIIGRLPAGSTVELRAMLTKIDWFEDAGPQDTWRRNMVLFADDAWSGLMNNYSYDPGERRFEWSIDEVASTIEEALPDGFDVKKLFMSHWTDEPHKNPGGDIGSVVYSRTNDSVRTYFTPYLVDRLNEGCLFYTYQGHAGRSNLTTEAGFTTSRYYSDQNRLTTDRQFVFIGMGCHISEFSRKSELSLGAVDGPNGDCLSEQLLFKPGSGAVAAYASAAYEFLGENATFCERLHEVLFKRPPTDSVPPDNEYTGAHWVLGEAVFEAEVEHIDMSHTSGMEQVARYILLGDPMLKIDPGPPLMSLEADRGQGWEEVDFDSLEARGGTNECDLRFTVSDVVALGGITLEIDGEDMTDSLVVVALKDADRTYSRSYSAEFDYTINLFDNLLVFDVYTPENVKAGTVEIPIATTIRLYYNDDLQITPLIESPSEGDFRIVVDFPAYLYQQPMLLLDGNPMSGVELGVRDPQDSLRWEASFGWKFNAGPHILTVQVGEFAEDFAFTVAGSGLVVDTFNFPNPFSGGTNIAFLLNLPADRGKIKIFNVSGRLIRTLHIPTSELDARPYYWDPNSVYWDGRDLAGDRIANGTYIYVIQLEKGGSSVNVDGKCVKLE